MSVVVSLNLNPRQFDTRSYLLSNRPCGHLTREADELLIEAELAALYSIPLSLAFYPSFHSKSVFQSRKSA